MSKIPKHVVSITCTPPNTVFFMLPCPLTRLRNPPIACCVLSSLPLQIYRLVAVAVPAGTISTHRVVIRIFLIRRCLVTSILVVRKLVSTVVTTVLPPMSSELVVAILRHVIVLGLCAIFARCSAVTMNGVYVHTPRRTNECGIVGRRAVRGSVCAAACACSVTTRRELRYRRIADQGVDSHRHTFWVRSVL